MSELLRRVHVYILWASPWLVLLAGLAAFAGWTLATPPGLHPGCNPAPPPGWSHYPDWLRSILEQYCGS